MNAVYKFGGSKPDAIEQRLSSLSKVLDDKNFITGYIENKKFFKLNNSFAGDLITGIIVDERIELTRAVLLLGREYPDHPLYWNDKKLTLGIFDNSLPDKQNKQIKYFNIRGDKHNVSYIDVPISETIEAGKIYSFWLQCSPDYESRKPSDESLIPSRTSIYTTEEQRESPVPFSYATIKLYFKYK